jgi:hypothetical protein
MTIVATSSSDSSCITYREEQRLMLIDGEIEEVEAGCCNEMGIHAFSGLYYILMYLTSDVGLKAAREDAKTVDDIAARVFEDDEPRHPIHLHQDATGSTIKLDCQRYRFLWSNSSSL